MSRREKIKIPKRYIEKHGTDKIPLWSFSKVNSYKNCSQEYLLSRIKKLKGEDNIYSLSGSAVHEAIEDFYSGKIKYEDMAERFESEFLNIEISDFKFSNDESKNENMQKKYRECVSHFLRSHNTIKSKVILEQLIWIEIEDNLFMGYVDVITKDDEGNYHIIDWKTSTIYTGQKIKDNANQLLLYALGLHQAGVPLENIKVAWNFVKYCHISFKQKNGKVKTTRAERHAWVQKIKTPLKRDIIEIYGCEGWEADLKIEECIKENSIERLDKKIQDRYTFDDCYVYPEVTEEALEELKKEFVGLIKEINDRGKDEKNWQREEIQPNEEYYCSVLCSMKKFCSYYTVHLERKGLKKKEDDDLMKLLEDELPF